MTKAFSIVIPAHNGLQTLRRTLDSLMAQDGEYAAELILVDDASTDGTVQIALNHALRQRWPIQVVKNVKGGLANGYNIGIEAACGEIIIIMHQDCYLTDPGAIALLLAPFQDKHVVASMSRVQVPTDAWSHMSFWDKVANARYTHRSPYTFGGKFDALRRDTILSIGGFDAFTFHGAGEDWDVLFRLRSEGEIAKSNAYVVHAHCYPPKTGLWSFCRKQRQLGEGFGAIVRKHFPEYPEREFQMIMLMHAVKFSLCIMSFIPITSVISCGVLFLFGILYSGRVLRERDIRIVLAPFVHVLGFYMLCFSILAGISTGKQNFDYNYRGLHPGA